MGGSWVTILWLVRTRIFSCGFMAIWAQAAKEVLSCGTCVCKIYCMSPLVEPQGSIKSRLGFSFEERDQKQSRGNAEDEKMSEDQSAWWRSASQSSQRSEERNNSNKHRWNEVTR